MEKLIRDLRKKLDCGQGCIQLPEDIERRYNPEISQVYITLFQSGKTPIQFGAKTQTLQETLEVIVTSLRESNRIQEFDIADSDTCRILLEMVTHQRQYDITKISEGYLRSQNRFEPGVTGYMYTYAGKTYYFMPSDAYTQSIMSVRQLLNLLSKKCGIAKQSPNVSERIRLMFSDCIDYYIINSIGYISYKDHVLKIYRGVPEDLTVMKKGDIYEMIDKTNNWLIEHMRDDGSFLYYYDATQDTEVDFQHSKMLDPLYNNILRHSGGICSLLRAYEVTGKSIYKEGSRKAIDFLTSTFREHEYEGSYACYPFFNQKSKLGGAGIGLTAMMQYYIQTGEIGYREYLDGLVRHILSRIDGDGEMIGYYSHPKFQNGEPLTLVDDETKKQLFSFYYPGEALLGLALYYLHIPDIETELKCDIQKKAEKALDFLVDTRPVKYKEFFTSLPSDSWLMQAIEKWVKVDGFKKQSYIDFVFHDTNKMFQHMYTQNNTTHDTRDYIGGFYYQHGDHVYHDGSRCEGVVSAYYLAKYLGDTEKVNWIMHHMLLSAQGLTKTYHTPKSVYPFINQRKALHTFRFKLTRQWIRVDSIQHASCFFSRLYLTEDIPE